MQRLIDQMKMHTEAALSRYANPTIGFVSSYDPDNYCCKITLSPDDPSDGITGAISGWIPCCTIWAGNEWGVFCPPSVGDMVEIDYQESDFDAGHVDWRLFNDDNRPVRAESGVFYIIHKSGTSLKFENDGSVSLTAFSKLNVNSPQINLNGYVKTNNHVEVSTGASGVFTDMTGKMITVKNGIVVGIK